MLEKRKFIRLPAPIGVTYQIAQKHKRARETPSFLRDLSGGGVRILVKDTLRRGALIDVRIQVPHLREPIKAVGEVVWFEPAKEKGSAEAGVAFCDIAPADLHRILEYVHHIGIG